MESSYQQRLVAAFNKENISRLIRIHKQVQMDKYIDRKNTFNHLYESLLSIDISHSLRKLLLTNYNTLPKLMNFIENIDKESTIIFEEKTKNIYELQKFYKYNIKKVKTRVVLL